ncbi:hypothetical protein [Gordonia sp. (in: high G+C Gram-positive bacteria)]|uniref:hypothetical protein n=1 Tax=Gordonia sp. (in: high G+C Gram-positive bacteria) TaxID=84139 RepID=UPI003C767BE1
MNTPDYDDSVEPELASGSSIRDPANVIEILFERLGENEGLPGIPDKGQKVAAGTDIRVPSWDVFSGWSIGVIYPMKIVLPGPGVLQFIDECRSWQLRMQKQLNLPDDYFTARLPRGDQFPRWIGPPGLRN